MASAEPSRSACRSGSRWRRSIVHRARARSILASCRGRVLDRKVSFTLEGERAASGSPRRRDLAYEFGLGVGEGLLLDRRQLLLQLAAREQRSRRSSSPSGFRGLPGMVRGTLAPQTADNDLLTRLGGAVPAGRRPVPGSRRPSCEPGARAQVTALGGTRRPPRGLVWPPRWPSRPRPPSDADDDAVGPISTAVRPISAHTNVIVASSV